MPEAKDPKLWSADALYRRGEEGRRVLLLELMAWAIHKCETFELTRDAHTFFNELQRTRKKTWGVRPWSGVTNSEERYLEHVRNMAEVFASSHGAEDAWYPNRVNQPGKPG
jgi:uncharacterized protein YaeQ